MEPDHKITLFLDKRDLGIIQPDNSYGTKHFSDWYVNVSFFKTNKLVEDYIHTYFDPFRTSVQRQLINPYFIEYGFFETIQSFSAATSSATEQNLLNINSKAKIYNIDINK